MKRIALPVLGMIPLALTGVACGSSDQSTSEPVTSIDTTAPSTVAEKLAAREFEVDTARPAKQTTQKGVALTGTFYKNANGQAAVLMRIESSREEHGVIFDPKTSQQLEQIAPTEPLGASGGTSSTMSVNSCLNWCEWEWYAFIFVTSEFDAAGDILEGCYQGCGS